MIFKFLFFLSFLAVAVGCQLEPTKVVPAPAPLVYYERPPAPIPDLPPQRPGFVTVEAAEDTMLLDAQTLSSERERLDTFYLNVCDRYNLGVAIADIEEGANKLLNSISNERFLKKVTSIGNAGCIFRVNQEDFGISGREYKKIEASMLLDFTPASIRAQNLQFLLQKRKPYLYLLDFATVVLEADQLSDQQCDLYCDLVEQPIGNDAFFASQGVDVQRQFDDEEALLAAFNNSPIAIGKGRIVQILESTNGWCMTSFDSSLAVQDSINENPFVLEAAIANGIQRSNRIYNFAAQEHLCTLPNGMWMMRLNGNDGLAATVAPGDIVRDINDREHDGLIRIGSCMGCHVQMAIKFEDEALRNILGNPAFDADEKLLGEVFFNEARIQAQIREVNSAYNQTLQSIGVSLFEDKVKEALISQFRRRFDVAKAASFTGLDVTDFIARLRGTAISSVALGNLLSGGTVSLADYSRNFEVMIDEMNLYRDSDIN